MIETNLLRISVMVLVISLCGPTHAAMPSIDRVEEDTTRVEDTLPFVPAPEDTTGPDEPAIDPSLTEAGTIDREPRTVGDVTIGLGYSAPQGTFTRYADVGFHALLRVNFRAQEQFPLSFWLGLTYTHFSTEDSRVYVEFPDLYDPYYGEAKELLKEKAYAVLFGVQLGNPTRRAFFRPRASFGVGLYVFATTVKYIALDWRDDEELWGYTDEILGRFGWRGVLGADFFFTPKWGIAVDLHYDHVLRLNLTAATESRNVTARFQGIAVGVVFAMEHMEPDD